MRSHLLFLTPAIFLAGCLTTQENPNYEFSSRYQTEGQIQTAQAPVADVTQVTYETETPVMQDVEIILEPSPTDAQYATQEVTGTPGYMVLIEEEAASSVQTITAAVPQAVDYDYSQNLIVADAPMATPSVADEIRILASEGQAHTVQQGDTIYALSRKQCVGVDILRGMNGIGADYAIQIGQTITLPESRC